MPTMCNNGRLRSKGRLLGVAYYFFKLDHASKPIPCARWHCHAPRTHEGKSDEDEFAMVSAGARSHGHRSLAPGCVLAACRLLEVQSGPRTGCSELQPFRCRQQELVTATLKPGPGYCHIIVARLECRVYQKSRRCRAAQPSEGPTKLENMRRTLEC